MQIPSGYREQLEILEDTLGNKRAPYFGPQLEYPREGRSIWEGYRGIEEYAREVFPIEEYNNGLRWMEEGLQTPNSELSEVNGASENNSRSSSRPMTPAGSAIHISGHTPRSHPEGGQRNFFVGSC